VPFDRLLLRRTWAELRRRKVVRAGATYAIIAWVVLQLAEITYEPLGLPGWALTWTVLAAVLGLPIVLVLSWFFDVTPGGIVRDPDRTGAGPAFAVAVVLLTVGGFGWWLADVYAPERLERQAADAAPASSAPQNTIAVLPFDDMSPQRDQGFLADGIAEELLDRLARSPGLRVAARTSSFAWRDSGEDIREIGRKLNVRWVLEGSVRKAEGRIRVTAQLIDAADGFHAWSETYDRADADLLALQDDVAASIADELSTRIGANVQAAGDSGTDDADALQAYLQGREAWRLRTPESLAEAEGLFRRAVELDPQFARAWSGLADTYLLQEGYGSRSLSDAIRLAAPAAERAVTLDPTLGEAWASIGLLRATAGQLDPAEHSLKKAMQLDPRYEMAPMWLASVYANQGRPQRQREVLEKAVELNPLEPVINVNLAGALAAEGRVDEARALLQQLLAVVPDDPTALRGLAEMEAEQGHLGPALRAARAAHASHPNAPANIVALARLLGQIEDFDRAIALLEPLPRDSRNGVLLRQEFELRRGGSELLPALADWLAQLQQGSLLPADRGALVLAAVARLRAGAADDAVRLLQRVVADPTRLADEPALLDAASLLAVALEQAATPRRRPAGARRWPSPAGSGWPRPAIRPRPATRGP